MIGSNTRHAIGTLVERKTRFVMLLHLPNGRTAPAVWDALTRFIHECRSQRRFGGSASLMSVGRVPAAG
jgi:Transposase and inactivated derivatives, IS30 family